MKYVSWTWMRPLDFSGIDPDQAKCIQAQFGMGQVIQQVF